MPNRLTDLEFDEVSFVRRGANQKAHVVLFKSDQTPGTADDPYESMRIAERTAELLQDSEPDLSRAEAIAKVYQSCQELYETGLESGAREHARFEKESIIKRMQKLGVEIDPSTVTSVAKANQQLETVAKSIQQRDGGTYAQSVLKALEADPELYQG
jgi:hypothetical protein